MEKITISDDKIFILVKDENDFIDAYNAHPYEDVLFVKGIGEFHDVSNIKYPQFFKKINPYDHLGIYTPYPKDLVILIINDEIKKFNNLIKHLKEIIDE